MEIIWSLQLFENILRPRRRVWEDQDKLNAPANEQNGRRTYDSKAYNAIGTVFFKNLQSEKCDINP